MGNVEQLLRQLTDWAGSRADVRSIVLVGSHARGAARPDSDVDLIILCERPDALLTETGWTRRFGTVVAEKHENWGRVASVRIQYADGLEVEFGIAAPGWASSPDAGTWRVLNAGFRVLVDRDACHCF